MQLPVWISKGDNLSEVCLEKMLHDRILLLWGHFASMYNETVRIECTSNQTIDVVLEPLFCKIVLQRMRLQLLIIKFSGTIPWLLFLP